MSVEHSAWSVYTRKHKGLPDSYFIYVANVLFKFIVLVNFGAFHVFSWLQVIFPSLIFALLQILHLVFFFFFIFQKLVCIFISALSFVGFFFLEKGDMNKNK